MTIPTKVSVCMITYNHENYIREAIEGVLMQVCEFKVELIVANDCSTDITNEVIIDILQNHPHSHWINYINHLDNKGMMPNFIWALQKCKGNYIALCDGDDYWTDPLKLQKQVDFLEKNPEYVISCHDTHVINEKGIQIRDSIFSNFHKNDCTKDQLMNGAFLMPLTMCFRNVINVFPKEFFKVTNGDVFLISLLGQYGKGRFQNEIIPAAYREHPGGVCSMISELEKENQRKNTYYQLFCYYQRINDTEKTAYNFFIKYKHTILRLLQRMLIERQIFTSLKQYIAYILKCIKYGFWKEITYITWDYLKLVKKQLLK